MLHIQNIFRIFALNKKRIRMKEFGKLLKQRRVELGISQSELSRRVGCTYVTLGHLESGKSVGMKTFIKVCKELQINIELKPINNND